MEAISEELREIIKAVRAVLQETPPELAISPVSFPNTTVQTESAPQQVDVVNNGEEAALTESPEIEGPAANEFKFRP